MSNTLSNTYSGAGTWTLQTAGTYFRLISSPTAVDMVFYRQGQQIATAQSMDTGFYLKPAGGFDRVDIYSPGAQTVKIMLIDGDGGYDKFNADVSGSTVDVSGSTVDVSGSTVGVTGTVGVSQAGTVNNVAAVSVGTAATLLVAASATRRGLRFYNAGSADIYIGGLGITTANGVVKVAPGELWVESEAAAAAWYGVSGTAAQSMRIQELTA